MVAGETNVTVSSNTMKRNASGTAVTNDSLSGHAESTRVIEASPRNLTATASGSGGIPLSWATGSPLDLHRALEPAW